jgi:hypothetical protein
MLTFDLTLLARRLDCLPYKRQREILLRLIEEAT